MFAPSCLRRNSVDKRTNRHPRAKGFCALTAALALPVRTVTFGADDRFRNRIILRRQRPAPAHIHRRVRHDDLHLRDRPDRGRCQRPDVAHLRRRHGHRVVLRRPGPAGDARAGSTGRGPRPRPRPTPIPPRAKYTVTNADGDTTATFNDDQGNLGETIDALGNITR